MSKSQFKSQQQFSPEDQDMPGLIDPPTLQYSLVKDKEPDIAIVEYLRHIKCPIMILRHNCKSDQAEKKIENEHVSSSSNIVL